MSINDTQQPTPEQLQDQLDALIAELELTKQSLDADVAPSLQVLDAALDEDERAVDAMDEELSKMSDDAVRKIDSAVLNFVEDERERRESAEGEEGVDDSEEQAGGE